MFDIAVKFCMILPDALYKTPTRSRDRASLGKGALMPSAKPRLEAEIVRHWAKERCALSQASTFRRVFDQLFD